MQPASIEAQLADPAYLELHLAAVASLQRVEPIKWYDAHFLRWLAAARLYLEMINPAALEGFLAGFAPLHPPPGAGNVLVSEFLPPDTHAEIRELARTIPAGLHKRHELEEFGRLVVHDHPRFALLQREVQARVEQLAGIALEPGYNFLSLYGGDGRCDPHMDEPIAMYTLDYCIEQSGEWPIHFSQLVDWPDAAALHGWDRAALLQDPALRFTPYVLQPNAALLFIGSSQWHYRQAITPGGFCNLLFLHYYPAGCADLVRPARWARHFGMAELQPLCDLFHAVQPD